jgi:hypothetical protein
MLNVLLCREKVSLAEDGWNSRDPEKGALAYTVDILRVPLAKAAVAGLWQPWPRLLRRNVDLAHDPKGRLLDLIPVGRWQRHRADEGHLMLAINDALDAPGEERAAGLGIGRRVELKNATAIISQIRLIDTRRLDQHITTIDKETFERIRKAVKDIL